MGEEADGQRVLPEDLRDAVYTIAKAIHKLVPRRPWVGRRTRNSGRCGFLGRCQR